MKHYKLETIPEHVKNVVQRTTCDMCSKTIEPDYHEIENTRVSCETGTSYPGCTTTETKFVDLCANCFEDVLIPFLQLKGCEIQTVESDW